MTEPKKKLTDEERLKLALERAKKSEDRAVKLQAKCDATIAAYFRSPESRRRTVLGTAVLKDALDPKSGIQTYVLSVLKKLDREDRILFAEIRREIQSALNARRRSQSRLARSTRGSRIRTYRPSQEPKPRSRD